MRFIPILLILFVALAIPCYAQKVNVDYNKEFDFNSLKTYSWQKGTPAANPLMEQRIVKAIEYNLAMKGFQQVESSPDFYVVSHASTKEELDITEWGYGRPRWGYSSTVDVEKVLVGTLIVDILEAKDKQLVWRGVATDSASDKPEKNEKKINKAAEKMFKKFPPGSGQK